MEPEESAPLFVRPLVVIGPVLSEPPMIALPSEISEPTSRPPDLIWLGPVLMGGGMFPLGAEAEGAGSCQVVGHRSVIAVPDGGVRARRHRRSPEAGGRQRRDGPGAHRAHHATARAP